MEEGSDNSKNSSIKKESLSFFRYHFDQIIQHGLPVLLRKLLKLLVLIPFIPVVLIIRILRPLVLVRFSPFSSEVIGVFVTLTELYLCRREAGIENRRTFDVFYHNRQPCNMQLKKMWDRTLHVFWLARPIDILNRALPGGEKHVIPWPEHSSRDVHGLLPRTPVHLFFTPEEERFGRSKLRKMGIPEGAVFVCFYSHDPAYKDFVYPDRDHYSYRYRDSDIQNHLTAMDELTNRGYYTVRMGAIVKEPLLVANPMIIDYATDYRSDFMDIYLCAKCSFYIGDEGGLNRVPSTFRTPLANLNALPLSYTHTQGPNDLFIPKKLWLREEQRLLTFRNIFDYGFSDFTRTEQYEQTGLEAIENTAKEITALAVELDERLKGTWQTTEEDEELQKQFWSLFKPTIKEMHGLIESRIGTEFLRQNQELLE